jgi:hypothetical protein
MICNVCGSRDLRATVYRFGPREAPAMECASCKTLVVTEEAADTDEERESVRRVLSLRCELSKELPATIAPPGRDGMWGPRA